MRVVNATKDPLYVDSNSLGLTVRREVNGQFYGFDDQACVCRSCQSACDHTCLCPDAGSPMVRKVGAGDTTARDWDGVVQVSGSSVCTDDGTCLSPENAPLNEPFSLELCYAAQRPNGVQFNDAGVGLGRVPATSRTCVNKTFLLQDGVVEIGPQRGAACVTSADCKGTDELCFDGACTAGCPANDFPTLGSNWSLIVASPDNMGFFTQSPRGTGKQFSGTGTITSVVYVGTSLQVSLTRPGLPNEQLTGKFTVQLPPMTGAPLQVGATVDVTVVDDGQKTPTRAVVVRDPGNNTLLLAADMGQDGALLTAADLAPFTITSDETPIGCTQDGCGKQLFFSRTVSSGAVKVSVQPGKTGSLTLSSGRWTVLSVSNGKYPTTRCDFSEIRPWMMWKEQ
jgi:hypothetical protein